MSTTRTFAEALASLAVSITTIATWVAGILPPLAALAALLFTVFQWYHSAPMKEWRRNRQSGRK